MAGTKSRQEDPWPALPRQTRRRTVANIFACGLAALLAAIAWLIWRSGDSAAGVVAKYVALFGFSWVLMIVMGLFAEPWFQRRASVRSGLADGQPATVVPGSAMYFGLFQTIWISYAILAYLAAAEIAAAGSISHWPVAVLLLLAAGTAAASAPALTAAGRLRPGGIALTPDGLVVRGWSSRTTLRWTEITHLRCTFDRMPLLDIVGTPTTHWHRHDLTPSITFRGTRRQIWMLDSPPHRSCVVLECPRFAVDRRKLHRYLTYYLENPSARPELGTHTALERWSRIG
ncbi:hypothetical protein [Nocardia asteroides]|uniref:hypothetical protein n=1 Tax=Nocardia asteroides TaxID=1824 RepID=UPI00341DE58F